MAEANGAPGVMVLNNHGKVDKHPTGEAIEIKDGHLFVLAYDTNLSRQVACAIYAPEVWRRAKLGNAERWSDSGE